ncbi:MULTISPECIES: serine/threonine protein kinase [Rahnella]|jgi:Ser/Thr protein kinase RdoA (MazF antagonist)|uniref:Stress response kinase A n=1 Tax=Rahnella victoriana TaxID=1510570 RepID=A0ABS0DXJ2_9GAMM|nr:MULTISPECIES: serine/threonine protein kinase [Rahnella]VTQ56294.1 serine/threonine protein kinase [Campylobacter jejuni]MBF7958625.1 serine/threonine protein kinase [Rahnella victoriana]PBI81183.1 stress response serine/threonine protein kinase YihE [Rahnella victoriana]TBX33525.1 serine/threonine protein kinase [Rahnella victoriana]TDS86598.1 Ser/Thr protein kinase RdoA (MazF antagonist) [Rahnella sp. BIGb0236]
MNNSAFNFQALSPDLILDALESVGLIAESGLTALNSYENRVYQFLGEDRKRYVVKFYRPERWSEEQIHEEHRFSLDMADAEIPAVAPLSINDNTLHHYQGYMFTVFPSVGGRQYEIDNLDQLEWVGRFLGRIHQVGSESLFTARPTIGLDEYLYRPREVLAECSLIPKSLREPFFAATDNLIATTGEFWHTDWQPLRLHGDCHPGNILWRDGPLFVDMDDARNGPAIQDLWMLLHGDQNEQRLQLDILLEAYGEFAELDTRELSLIEPLRAMRMVYYLAWVARRWEDPAFPKSFPWMQDEDFWRGQIAAFTEQVKKLQAPPLQLMPMY